MRLDARLQNGGRAGAALKTHLRSAKHRALIATLVEAREAAGLTQRALAAKLRRSDSFVWKFEAGERQLKVLELLDLADAVGVEPEEIIRRVRRASRG
jgi:transcriptional regulator with XRE-family HTH domain